MNKRVIAVAVSTVAVVAAATFGSSATASSAGTVASPYQGATALAADDTVDVEPQAIPGIIAAATVAARGFTAAKAPQQVSQAARYASFIHGLMGGPAHTRTADQGAAVEVIFD